MLQLTEHVPNNIQMGTIKIKLSLDLPENHII